MPDCGLCHESISNKRRKDCFIVRLSSKRLRWSRPRTVVDDGSVFTAFYNSQICKDCADAIRQTIHNLQQN